MDLVPSTFFACCQAPLRSRTKLRQKEPLLIKHHHYHGFTVLNAGSTQSIFIVNIIIIISRPLPVFFSVCCSLQIELIDVHEAISGYSGANTLETLYCRDFIAEKDFKSYTDCIFCEQRRNALCVHPCLIASRVPSDQGPTEESYSSTKEHILGYRHPLWAFATTSL